MDERLFAAWKAGDAAARDEAWTRLFTATYSWAVPFCRTLAPDDLAAREWAADAINQAHCEIAQRLERGFRWQGEPQFDGMFSNYVKRRCLDCFRKFLRASARVAGEAGEDAVDDDRVERSSSVPPAQEVDAIDVARTREAIDDLVCRLACQREICEGRGALVDVINAMLAYVHECCLRAVETVDATALTLDDLVPLLDRRAVEASSVEMNEFVMKRLGIGRWVLDNRLREIRKLLRRAQSDAAGGTSSPAPL